MEPILNKKIEKKFRKFQLNKKIISFKKATKNLEKYPYVVLDEDQNEIGEWVFIYPTGWYIIQYIDRDAKTKFYVPYETMQPILDTLEDAEWASFTYLDA